MEKFVSVRRISSLRLSTDNVTEWIWQTLDLPRRATLAGEVEPSLPWQPSTSFAPA
jgi:hypothetical protein